MPVLRATLAPAAWADTQAADSAEILPSLLQRLPALDRREPAPAPFQLLGPAGQSFPMAEAASRLPPLFSRRPVPPALRPRVARRSPPNSTPTNPPPPATLSPSPRPW